VLLLQLRAAEGQAGGAELGRRGAELGRRGDLESHRYLLDRLRRLRPHDAVLSEEAADDAGRLGASRVWIVDPLDGTREYGEPARTDWAVHVALAVEGHISAGAVALPARGLTLSTDASPSSASRVSEALRIVVSRTRPPVWADEVAARIGAELVPMGSAGAKAAAVVLGEADAYLHDGGQHEWDSAAPVGVALAYGLHASRADGSDLVYNQPLPWLPDLVICRAAIASRLLDEVSAARAALSSRRAATQRAGARSSGSPARRPAPARSPR